MGDLDTEIKRARVKRRIGFAFFGALTAYISVPMIVGAFSGVASGQIWDPYTGEHLSQQASVARWCFDEASGLLREAGTLDNLTRKWDERAKQWTSKCKDDHAELQQVMLETRRQLQAPKK